MTLIAGILSRDPRAPLGDAECEALRAALGRGGDEVVASRDARAYLAKIDIGAFGVPALRADADGSLTMVAGEPLIDRGGHVGSRADDTDALHDALRRGDRTALRSARGVFAVAHYEPSAGAVTLATDKLGIRPLFWYVSDERLVFASALHVLEALPFVDKQMDVRGVTEMIALGVPMGTRTPYARIRLLRPGAVVRVAADGVTRERYWRWDQIAESKRSLDELSADAFARFTEGVSLRRRGDRATIAYLSGGLDSRVITAALRRDGSRVVSFNFALPGTEDRVFGAQLAAAAGTDHQECDVGDPVDTQWSAIMANAWARSPQRSAAGVERPQLAWSGDGGSVGLGHVYLRPRTVDRLRAGDIDGAIEAFLEGEHAHVARRLLAAPVADSLARLPFDGVREELAEIHASSPLQAFYIFLMLNDQHRHLARHFEEIDRHRLEFHLPFFDSAFLEVIASVPIEERLYHKFYVRWLDNFPAYVKSVPWQAYPGHVPCPVPPPADLAYQWDPRVTARKRAMRKQQMVAAATALLAAGDFPRPLLKKSYLRLTTMAHRLGVRDYDYVLDAARTYHRYWQASGGAVSLPGAGT